MDGCRNISVMTFIRHLKPDFNATLKSIKRERQHKNYMAKGFTKRYNVTIGLAG
jgi:hypothetical protein